ncbi:MAG TPA: sensor domain-containing diguanylate cyclase [Nostocaceae cyanobacterium]|nr:sensor domain-containing diguanylate cyclase [Nostocaceae cyanobacterium]
MVKMTYYQHQCDGKSLNEKHIFLSIINSMACAVIVTYVNGCIYLMNPAAEALTGWRQDEAVGRNLTDVVSLIETDREKQIDKLAAKVIKTGEILQLPDNCILVARNGQEIPIGDTIAPLRDHEGNINGAVLVLQDITKRKQLEEKLLRNAFYDSLTALPNRVLFQDKLRQVIEYSKRKSNYQFAVLFLDLDDFKKINDRFGHGIGDDYLVLIARRLESCLRTNDIVARLGGDEFAIILDDIQSISDANQIAKRIQDSLKLPINLKDNQILTTASIGIAINCSHHQDPATILRDADIAMYQAKRQGKGKYMVFDYSDRYLHVKHLRDVS